MEEQSKKEEFTIKKSSLWKISTFVFGILLIISIFTGGFGYGKSEITGNVVVPTTNEPQDQFPTISVNMKDLVDEDKIKGDVNAPITIVEFSDYECPFCGRFFAQTLPSVVQDYINSGKARLVYRDFPLPFHPNAQKAAESAECAGKQNKYYEMHDKIFTNQQTLSLENYKKWAGEIGLNTDEFNTCLDSGETASEIQKDLQDGTAAGIQGTPGFIIGKTNGNSARIISGAYPFSAFQEVIESQL